MKTSPDVSRAFSGEVSVVTGAGSGIGRSLATQLAAAGAKVYAVDVDSDALAALAQEAQGTGALHPVVLDVTDSIRYAEIIAEIEQKGLPISFLFNNAGVTFLAEAHRMEFPRWKWLLGINVMGVVNGVLHVYPRMVKRGRGHIVNTASIAGSTGYATAAAYTTSKACILELSRSLGAEARAYGVKVSVACPGYVSTNIFSQERVLGADIERVLVDLPVAMMSPDKAAESILAGVVRGKKAIVFPLSARLLWHVSHWAPWLLGPIQRRLLRPFRSGY